MAASFIRDHFPKSSRLLTSQDFQGVFNHAPFKVSDRHVLILAAPNALEKPRLGLVIAKKNIHKAVQRNRVKRHIRETFRQHHNLPAIDAIVLARRGLEDRSDSELHQLLQRQWDRLIKKVAGNNKPEQ